MNIAPDPLRRVVGKISTTVLSSLALGVASCFALEPADLGMKNLLDFSNVDATGAKDSTQAINEAVAWCVTNDKTLFIPSGTYLVGDTIQGNTRLGAHTGRNTVVIVGDAEHRPVLKLRDHAAGFDAADKPRALIYIFGRRNETDDPKRGVSVLFNCGLRGLELDLGAGNAGAVGLDFDSAQDCFVEDVTIHARDGYAGMTGLPGRGSTIGNCEITGGRYGIHTRTVGPMLVGLKLSNQTVAALKIGCIRGTSIVGVEIDNCRGAGIETEGGSSYEQGHVSVVDVRIRLATGNAGPAILNRAQRGVQLTDVFVQGGGTVVDNKGDRDLAGVPGDWMHVARYNYVPAQINGARALNLVDGREGTGAAAAIEPVNAPPGDLRDRNIWPSTPSFATEGVIVVRPLPDGADNRDAIQRALDSHRLVQLVAGRYNVGGPLVLRRHSVLMGVPGLKSVLRPMWTAQHYEWCIDTDDAADADTYLLDIAVDLPDGPDFLGTMRWRVGKRSIARRFRGGLFPGHAESNYHNYEITGHGGGRWYGFHDHAALKVNGPLINPLYRKIYIHDTAGQPITFYGLNLERGGAHDRGRQYLFFEAVGVKNIRSFGSKLETEGTVFRFVDCENIFVSTCVTHNKGNPDDPMIEFRNSRNIEVHNVYLGSQNYVGTPVPNPMLADDVTKTLVRQGQYLGCYRSGTVDTNVWH